MSLKAEKGLKQRSREQCKARTKAGGPCLMVLFVMPTRLGEGLIFCLAEPRCLAERIEIVPIEKSKDQDRGKGAVEQDQNN
jgi:hypothetical protein